MAINHNPYLAFERDLTPEQLAEIQALTYRWTEPTSQTRWNDGGEYTISDPGFYGGKLSDDKFSPYLNWIPNYIGTGSGENFSIEIDPSGAGYWGPISQPANISNWGRSDRTGTWDPNTGKWLGYKTESTDLRDFANFVGTTAAMYFGGQALAGAGGGGAAATGATSGATTAGAGGLNWGAVGTAAAKNAAINAGLTLAQGGDMGDALRAGAIGAVSGGAGGVAAGYGVNPILAGAATGGGISALQGGDGRGILTGAATGALSGYGQTGITGNAIADRALVGAGNALIRGGGGRDAVTGAVMGALASGANAAMRDGTGTGVQQTLGQSNVGGTDVTNWNTGGETDWGAAMTNTYDPSIYDFGQDAAAALEDYNVDWDAVLNGIDPGTLTGNYWGQDGGGSDGNGIDWGSLMKAGVNWLLGNGGGKNGQGGGGAMLPALLGAVAGALDSRDKESTSSRAPWAPMQPYLLGLAEDGRGLYNQLKAQPFSPAQQTAYNNVGGLLDVLNLNAGGLLQGMQANATGQNKFVRGQPRQLIGSAPIDGMAFQPGLLGNFGTRRG